MVIVVVGFRYGRITTKIMIDAKRSEKINFSDNYYFLSVWGHVSALIFQHKRAFFLI